MDYVTLFDLMMYCYYIPTRLLLDQDHKKFWKSISTVFATYYGLIQWNEMTIEHSRNYATGLLAPTDDFILSLHRLCSNEGEYFYNLTLPQIIIRTLQQNVVAFYSTESGVKDEEVQRMERRMRDMVNKCFDDQTCYKSTDSIDKAIMAHFMENNPTVFNAHTTGYIRQKLLFEQHNAKILNECCYIHRTFDFHRKESWTRMTPNQFAQMFGNITFIGADESGEQKKKRFIAFWMNDPDISCFESVINDPTLPPGPHGKFMNVFPSPMYKDVPIPNDYHTVAEPYFDFAKKMLGVKESEYFFAWLKQIIERPKEPTRIALILSGLEGTGKSTLFDFIRDYILGCDITSQTGRIEELTEKHSTLRENTLLVQFDEVQPTNFNKNQEFFKNLITTTTIRINPKGGKMYNVDNLCNYCFTTNSKVPLVLSNTDRRYVLMKANDCYRMDRDFWVKFKKEVMTKTVGRAVVERLRKEDYSHLYPLEFNRPVTEMYTEIRTMSIPNHFKFLSYFTRTRTDGEYAGGLLQSEYRKWCEARGVEANTRIFMMELQRIPTDQAGIRKKRTSVCVLYTIQLKKLEAYLESIDCYHESDQDGYRVTKKQKIQ